MKPFLVPVFVAFGCLGAELRGQATLTNDDVPNLAKAGLSEEFTLNVIDQQGSKLSSDATRLVELKNNGVSERIIAAIARKITPQEPLTSYGLILLAKAQFSEGFLLDLVNQRPGQIATDAARLIELKRAAGLSESVISAVVKKSPPAEQLTSGAVVHLVRAGFSEGFIIDVLSRQPGKFTTEATKIVELKQAA